MHYSLVVQTSFLGDVVLTTPLLARLAERGPVDVVVTPGGAPVLANNPDLRRVIVYDKRGSARGALGFAAMVRQLAAARRDAEGDGQRASTAYLAQGSFRSAALALVAGFRVRVGFSSSSGRRLYTRRVPYRDDKHHAERLWLLGEVGGTPAGAAPGVSLPVAPTAEHVRPRLYPGERERDAVDRVLSAHGHSGDPLIALAPGSVWATKRWPYYAELAEVLSADGRIVVVGGGEDTELANAIARAARSAVIDATERLSLLGSAELLRRCEVLVTNDSAPQHLASAMGTPTVTVFGPTVPEFGFGPLAPRSIALGHSDLDCRPCDRHGPRRCPLGHWRCMRELRVALVADAARAAIAARAG